MNVKKSLVKIIAIFAVIMCVMAFAGRVLSVFSSSDKNLPPVADTSGAYKDALTDFEKCRFEPL